MTPPLAPTPQDPQLSLAPLVERVAPAVVNIRATGKAKRRGGVFPRGGLFEWFFGPREREWPPFFQQPEQEYERRSLGSGFVIDNEDTCQSDHRLSCRANRGDREPHCRRSHTECKCTIPRAGRQREPAGKFI